MIDADNNMVSPSAPNRASQSRRFRVWTYAFLFLALAAVFVLLNDRMDDEGSVFLDRARDIHQHHRVPPLQNHHHHHHHHQQQQQQAQGIFKTQPLRQTRGGLSPEAKAFLMAGARGREQQEQQQQQQRQQQREPQPHQTSDRKKIESEQAIKPSASTLPPLYSLIGEDGILADVQWLLDFAIVGFGKCGTTSLLQWLQRAPQVRAPDYEAQFLHNRRPENLVKKLYDYAEEEQELKNMKLLKGFKNPSDIRRAPSRQLLAEFWPHTPLIVTVRHPVTWMASLMNYFRIEKGRHKANLTSTQMIDVGGRDGKGDTRQFVSTAKGEFHAMLAEVGKTSLDSAEEWELLQPWLLPTTATTIRQHRLPNRIFFMEMTQMSDANQTRAQQFAHDLEAFLGLPRDALPPALHVRPNTDRVEENVDVESLKVDICAPEYGPVKDEMMQIARSASSWFRHYFLASPDVVASSPEFLRELLMDWITDPCEKKRPNQPSVAAAT